MPTPTDAFVQIAARHGGVDPRNGEAIQRWYTETLPTLPPKKLEAVLEDLLEQDGNPPDAPQAPSYPPEAPLPKLEAALPVPLPLLAAGWAVLLRRILGR